MNEAENSVNGPDEWVQFTKRTGFSKLPWLRAELCKHGIANRINGRSFHAPILQVQSRNLGEAWDILDPIDDIEDDDPMFSHHDHPIIEPLNLGDMQ